MINNSYWDEGNPSNYCCWKGVLVINHNLMGSFNWMYAETTVKNHTKL